MRTIHQSRRGTSLSTWMAVAASCVCGTAVAQDTPAAAAGNTPAGAMKEDAAKADEAAKSEADYRNWFDVSVGGNFISGNKAAFQQRHQLPRDFYGGVEEFHYEQDIGKKGLLEID